MQSTTKNKTKRGEAHTLLPTLQKNFSKGLTFYQISAIIYPFAKKHRGVARLLARSLASKALWEQMLQVVRKTQSVLRTAERE
jgi:hypothetical protein